MRSVIKTILVLLIAATAACAAVPPMISYQGRLMQPSGAAVPDGTYSMQFAIYDVPTGGTALWSETNPSVAVKGGLFATMLGSVVNLPSNIFDNPNRFFGVKVGSDPEMTPRQQIASSAFAFRSAVAGTVDDGSITTSKLADGAVTEAKIADGNITTAKIANRAVATDDLAEGSVTATKLGSSAIMLGYAETKTDFHTQSGTPLQVPGLQTTVNVPDGRRKVKITVWCASLKNTTTAAYSLISLWDGPVTTGTMIAQTCALSSTAFQELPASIVTIQSLSQGTKTYSVGLRAVGGDAYMNCGGGSCFILVELI